jgi:hypothetical protein
MDVIATPFKQHSAFHSGTDPLLQGFSQESSDF